MKNHKTNHKDDTEVVLPSMKICANPKPLEDWASPLPFCRPCNLTLHLKKRFIIAILFLIPFQLCMGHSTSHSAVKGGTGIMAHYDDKKPMNYCDVKVFAPGDSKTEFQTGMTDKNGRFLFFPDTTGTWHIVVDDGMGHLMKVDIDIGETSDAQKQRPAQLSRFSGAIVGISLIFGLFGISTIFLPIKRFRK
ncbi:MAG: hypothetical protein KAH23_04625 [Kiritimatiellae bacterium]|nr:hypothetical protein [Kiritimatiellia bacterium]